MALNVGQDFKKRWLQAPEAVRQAFLDDLARICDLLQPSGDIQQWLTADQLAQKASEQKIAVAYANLKAELLEQARIRRQLALEKALEDKRAAQAAYAAALQQHEIEHFTEQTLLLSQLRAQLDQEIQDYTQRYQQNPAQPSIDYSHPRRLAISDEQILSELESVRLRLELEAETLIEEAVSAFRNKLQAAAQEEISYILQNSDFSDQPIKN